MKLEDKEKFLKIVSEELERELEISRIGNFKNNYERNRNCSLNIDLEDNEKRTSLEDLMRYYYIDKLEKDGIIDNNECKQLYDLYLKYKDLEKTISNSMFTDSKTNNKLFEQTKEVLNTYGILDVKIDINKIIDCNIKKYIKKQENK